MTPHELPHRRPRKLFDPAIAYRVFGDSDALLLPIESRQPRGAARNRYRATAVWWVATDVWRAVGGTGLRLRGELAGQCRTPRRAEQYRLHRSSFVPGGFAELSPTPVSFCKNLNSQNFADMYH